ncbi:hypothetical protein BDZ91DRAFT_721230, partial [Kalaharituber pfeilii]
MCNGSSLKRPSIRPSSTLTYLTLIATWPLTSAFDQLIDWPFRLSYALPGSRKPVRGAEGTMGWGTSVHPCL